MIAQRIVNRPKMVLGNILPLTRTSRVPRGHFNAWIVLLRWHFTITSFIETVITVTVVCEYCHLMAAILKANSCVNNKSFGAANTQIWVNEGNLHYSVNQQDVSRRGTFGSGEPLSATQDNDQIRYAGNEICTFTCDLFRSAADTGNFIATA